MSVITFQIGQCGNQVGQTFYDFIMREMINAPSASQAVAGEAFFDYNEKKDKYEARSILVDMEPKVINECLSSAKRENLWDYDKSMSLTKQEGSGNNWAFGHNSHGPELRTQVLEKFSHQLEKADYLDAVVFFQSLAGGTGSGFGSYLVEAVRDEYPEICIMNIAIMPHLTGEVIVQNYNTTLTCSKLYDHSDAILLFENDLLNIICKELLHLKKPGLDDMNKVLATMITSFLYPVLSNKKKGYYSVLQNGLNLSNLINELLVTSPLYKLLSLKNVPQMPDSYKDFTTNTWSGLEKRLFQMAMSNTCEGNINWQVSTKSMHCIKSISNLLIVRGNSTESDVFPTIEARELYTKQITSSYTVLRDSHRFGQNERSLCLLSNSQAYLKPLETILQNTYRMIHARAYVYQYEKHGLTVEDFKEALAKIEQIYHNYSEL